MKQIKNILKTVGLAACVGAVATSCDLEILPMNEVVLENFWTDKNDVENVLRSCYVGMEQNEWIDKAITWGEVRSDNLTLGADVPGNLKDLIKGNLKQKNSVCDWSAFYTVINRCNTVIFYAPQVAEKDPNFTPSDLEQTLAQARGIRALNYFYLIRTFKDVPFSFTPSIDDSQDYKMPASKCEDILDTLIMDIEECKDLAPRRFTGQTSDPNYKKNSGRFTRLAMYSLLADMYLWRASDANLDPARQQQYYRRCVECCDYVINYKMKDYANDEDGTLNRKMDSYVLSTYGYPLLVEMASSTGSSAPAAYNAIFGEGNSWESIFELTFSDGDTELKNSGVALMYGGYNNQKPSQQKQYTAMSSELLPMGIKKNSSSYNDKSLFPVTSDLRSLTSFRYQSSGDFQVLKYVVRRFAGSSTDFGSCTATDWTPASSDIVCSSSYGRASYSANTEGWIIYRLTDVMLMRAEAEIQMANLLSQNATPEEEESDESAVKTRAAVEGSSLSTASELYDDAFNLISAVYVRSNPISRTTTSFRPSRNTYTSYDAFMALLENERHREFLFEGKRYYDLVRRARREGNTVHFAQAIAPKFGEASKSVLIKMAMMDFMYMPYLERQLDVNPYLKQNPAYGEDEEIIKN